MSYKISYLPGRFLALEEEKHWQEMEQCRFELQAPDGKSLFTVYLDQNATATSEASVHIHGRPEKFDFVEAGPKRTYFYTHSPVLEKLKSVYTYGEFEISVFYREFEIRKGNTLVYKAGPYRNEEEALEAATDLIDSEEV